MKRSYVVTMTYSLTPGTSSIYNTMLHSKISKSLDILRSVLTAVRWLWHLTVSRQHCYRWACLIFPTLWDLPIRRPVRYAGPWILPTELEKKSSYISRIHGFRWILIYSFVCYKLCNYLPIPLLNGGSPNLGWYKWTQETDYIAQCDAAIYMI